MKVVDCSEDNMKVNLFKWVLRYLKGNVNGESHSQQSQKGHFPWGKEAFCQIWSCAIGLKLFRQIIF